MLKEEHSALTSFRLIAWFYLNLGYIMIRNIEFEWSQMQREITGFY